MTKGKVWKFTHIHHPIRIIMGLSVNEYCVLDLIYQSQVHPSFTVEGWSDRSYQKIGEFLGISKSTVHSIVSNAIIKGFAEINLDEIKLKRTTENWYDFAYLDEVTNETISELQNRSILERSKTERKRSKTERKRSKTERHTSESNKVTNELLQKEEEIKILTSEDVKREMRRQGVFTDTPENRIIIWNIFEKWIDTENFQTQFEFYSDRAPDVEAKPLMKVWVSRVNWFDLKEVRINKIQGWVKKAQEQFNKLKNVKNGKNRNNENLQSAQDAEAVFRKLQQEGI